MTNVQSLNSQETLSNMLLSPEAKEFIPRHFTDDPGKQDSLTGAGLLGAGPTGLVAEECNLSAPEPVNSLPSYMTTCYPFVAGGDARLSGRGRIQGKYSQQAVYMQQLHNMPPGMPQTRFPHPPKAYPQSNAWGNLGDMFQHFGSMPNGMPFDGGTYQNGVVPQPLSPYNQRNPQNTKLTSSPSITSDMERSKRANGMIKPNRVRRKPHEGDDTTSSSKSRSRTTAVQTDFPAQLANSTLEDVPNTLYNGVRHVSHSDQRSPTSRLQGQTATTCGDINTSNKTYNNSISVGFNTVSNGTNPVVDFNNEVVSMATGHVTGCMRSSSALSSNLSSYHSDFSGNNESVYSMQDSNHMMPSRVGNSPSVPVTLSYASIAQGHGKGQGQNKTSQHKTQNQVAMVTAKICDNNVVSKRQETSKLSKGRLSAGRLGNVNVAEIMEDLERADKNKNNTDRNITERSPQGVTSVSDEQTVIQTGRRSDTDVHNTSPQGTAPSSSALSQSLYSKVVENSKPSSLKSQGHPTVHVKGQGHLMQSDKNKSDLDLDRKGQSQSDNNNNQGENGDVKKKRRRRRRRKKKSGEVTEDDEHVDVNLHFEDEEEFPDLSGLSNCDTKSSPNNQTLLSYSDILRTNNTVQSTTQEEGNYVTGASPVKESRTSRKRRKRREVANKAADAEMAEIGLEQHMLELKMKQKLPLAAKKSVSPVRNTTTQGVWKLTPASPTTAPSSTGKKVSLLLPGTVAQEPAHNATPHQPNTGPIKQPGILKTSQPVNTSASSGGSGGKKSKQPITYDLSALIDAAETKKEQKESKPVIIKKDDLKPHNILDSSAPTKRGKERETPKTKKPSPLKKVILKEREEKKRLRMLDEDEVTSGAPVGIGVVSGGESDLSQDASFKGSMDIGLGTPASAELSPISQPSPSCMSPISPGASPMSSGVNSPITGTIQQTVKLKIHSRRFREYCNQVLDKEIDNHVTLLLQDLVRFQDKQYHKDPLKAKSKRRFVLGLREVTKHLKLRKVKCVVISPNLEKIQSKGGLDDALNTILELCNDQKVPFIFALGRRALGRACAKLVPVSVVGVFNYEGSEENFRSLVALTEKARDAYREMIVQIEKEIAEHPPRASVPGVPHIFAHMGHSRTPSGCSVISFTSSILSEPISENYPHSEPETDNRGYEIERDADDDNDDDDDVNDDGKDPYEADDEGGSKGRKSNATRLYSDRQKESGNSYGDVVDETGDGCVTTAPYSDKNNGNDNKNVDKISDTQHGADGDKNETDDDDSSDSGDNSYDDDDDDDLNNGNDTDDDNVNEDISDAEHRKEGEDTVEELPTFIDSVHNFDPFSEILSQHSSKTMENGEDVMSTHSSKTTHSSRTLGDGSGLAGDKVGKIIETKNAEKVNTLSLKGKPEVDKNLKELRTRSWVKEAQTLHFSDQVDRPRDSEERDCTGDLSNVGKECLDMTS